MFNKLKIIFSIIFSVIYLIPTFSFSQQNVLEERAKVLFNEGVELYKQGDFKKAVEKMRQAYELKQLPPILYNIAVTYEKVGDLSLAIEYYKLYLEKGARKTEQKEIKLKIEELGKKIKEQTQIEEGETKPLVPKESKIPETQPETQTKENISINKQKEVEPETLTKKKVYKSEFPWKWVGLGASSLFLATGITFGILSRINYNDTKELSNKSNPTKDDEKNLDSLKSKVKWQSLTADITIGLALAGTGATIYFFLTDKTPDSKGTVIVPQISQDFMGVGAIIRY